MTCIYLLIEENELFEVRKEQTVGEKVREGTRCVSVYAEAR